MNSQEANQILRAQIGANQSPARANAAPFTRLAIAKAVAQATGNLHSPEFIAGYCQRRWPNHFNRADAGATNPTALTEASGPALAFDAQVRQGDIDGALVGVADIPPKIVASGLLADPVAQVVANGQAINVSSASFSEPFSIDPAKVAALVVATNRLWQAAVFERTIREALLRAARLATDTALLAAVLPAQPTVSGAGASVAEINSALYQLLASLSMNPESVTLATTPQAALGLSLLLSPVGTRAFPDMTPSGGSIAGMRVVVSRAVPAATLVAIDGSGLARARGAASEITVSSAASIAMDTVPSGNVVTPAGETKKFAHLWQTESTAVRIVSETGWHKLRDNVAGFIADFAPGSAFVTT